MNTPLVVRHPLVVVSLFIFLMASFSGTAVSQPLAPVLHYQGRLTNPQTGAPIEGEVAISFTIHNSPTENAFIWSESKNVQVKDGLFSTLLGDTSPLPQSIFNGQSLWLAIQVARDNPMTPRQRIAPVAYSLFSGNADLLDGEDGAFYRNASNLNSGTLSTDRFSAYQDLGVEGRLVGNVGTDILLRDVGDTRYWRVGGNSVSANTTLGITSSHTLDIVAGNMRFFRLLPHAESPNIIGGYSGNAVINGVYGAVIGGGGGDGGINIVTDNHGVIGGGRRNQAGNGEGTVSDAPNATVGGGNYNTASGRYSTVSGGALNVASANGATVSGGDSNVASAERSSVGGGYSNQSSGTGAVVAGGVTNAAGANYATVGGGQANFANRVYSTVSGGQGNVATGERATVAGGYDNIADGYESVVGGGLNNVALGFNSTVPGGELNRAEGNYSLTAGRRAKAYHDGAFVWADSQNADFASDRNNQFKIRAAGGMHLVAQASGANPAALRVESTTANGVGAFITQQSNDATLVAVNRGTGNLIRAFSGTTGGNLVFRVENNGAVHALSFTPTSDRNAKENFEPVDAQSILEQVARMPVSTWNFKSEDAEVRHMGPTAQDFKEAFGLGADDVSIATVDADGVALAAIQGLHQRSQILQAENSALKEQVNLLEARLAALEQAMGIQ